MYEGDENGLDEEEYVAVDVEDCPDIYMVPDAEEEEPRRPSFSNHSSDWPPTPDISPVRPPIPGHSSARPPVPACRTSVSSLARNLSPVSLSANGHSPGCPVVPDHLSASPQVPDHLSTRRPSVLDQASVPPPVPDHSSKRPPVPGFSSVGLHVSNLMPVSPPVQDQSMAPRLPPARSVSDHSPVSPPIQEQFMAPRLPPLRIMPDPSLVSPPIQDQSMAPTLPPARSMSVARNPSRMGFGSELQSKTAHDAILRLNDQELRLMDTLKRVVSHRMRADKDYATALQGIGHLATKFDTDAQLSHNNSPLLKAWNHLIEETDRICKLIRSNAEEVQSIVEKLALLIRDKQESKKQYMQERTRIDSEFMKARQDVNENLSTYKKSVREARESKAKYEEQLQKGNKVKDIDRAKEKYKKCVIKLHKSHNDYVLSLRAAGLHQEHYRNNILPRLLECLQQTQESQVAQMKQVLVEHCNLINSASGKFLSHYNSIMQNMVEIRPEKEYGSFVENYRMEPPAMETFAFDPSPAQDFPDGLKENTIVLDTLTIEAIQHSHSSLDEQLKNTRDRLTAKKQELKNLDEEIRAIPSSPKEEGAILDLLSKQKQYRDVSREIQELRCQEAKLATQYSMLDTKLGEMGDEDNLPLGIIFPEGGGTGTLSTRSTIHNPNLNSSTDSTTEQKSMRSNLAKMTKIFKGRGGHDSSNEPSNNQPTEIPLKEEEFYHGALPRKETEALLVNDGDFLVREKSDAWGRYVLSAKHASKVRHFPIQINDENMYRLEGDAFPTVGELIRFQLSSRQPVTKASQAVLLKPVCRVRSEHDLRHEEIELEEKLGAGHFGDVHRGRIKRTQLAVAVKTCKETVDAATRRKFLQEANILKQYDHANIVKLIGVCTDKHPIYIVMELVPGGDLLSFLRNDTNDLTTKQRVKMGEDAASGMAYLESKQCIHRDLAARNCLVGNKNVIKISDFGMSREDDVYTIREGAMRQIPIKWTAPEAMNFGKYTSMSDVWSFGILLWEIFSNGSTPYPGMTNNEAREKVGQGYRMPPPDNCPDEVRVLMENCWKMEDEDRPKFKEAQTALKRAYKSVR